MIHCPKCFLRRVGVGVEVDQKILQGIIQFRRAILADTPPPIKRGQFRPCACPQGKLDMKISCPEKNSLAIRQWPLGYLGRGYKLRGQHVDPFSHCSIWPCCTASDLALAHKKQVSCTINNLSNNENKRFPAFCGKAICQIGQAR